MFRLLVYLAEQMFYKQKFKTVYYVIAVNYLGNCLSGEFQQYQNS